MVVKSQIVRGVFYADYYAGGYRLFRGSYNLNTCAIKFTSDPHRPFVLPGMVYYRLSLRFIKLCRFLFRYGVLACIPDSAF